MTGDPPVAPREPRRVDVLGVGVSAVSMDAAVGTIAAWIKNRRREYVCVTGVHGVMESQRDPALREIHNASGMTTPDGMPMVWAGRRAGASWMTRVYGPDLLLAVLERGVAEGWRSYFYGGAPGVADELATRMRERFPGLRVVGTTSPAYPPVPGADVEMINAAAPDLVWVGLSTPTQERWMAAHRAAARCLRCWSASAPRSTSTPAASRRRRAGCSGPDSSGPTGCPVSRAAWPAATSATTPRSWPRSSAAPRACCPDPIAPSRRTKCGSPDNPYDDSLVCMGDGNESGGVMRPDSSDEVRAFVAARRPALYRSAYLLVGNAPDAEDLVQATLVRVIGAWDRIRRRDAPEVFARRVMVNLAASRWRRLKTHASIMRSSTRASVEPDVAESTAERDAVWAAIKTLPVGMRAVVVLRFYEDLSEAEIAAVLGCSPGTVKSQCSKAMSHLRRSLNRTDPPAAGGSTDPPTNPLLRSRS